MISWKGDDDAAPTPEQLAAYADGELDGQVFLDRDELGELGVEGAVGDAKAAMTDHGVDAVITEPRAERQGLNVVLGHERAKTWRPRCAFAGADTSTAEGGAAEVIARRLLLWRQSG